MVSFKLVKEIEKDVLHLVTSVGTKRVSILLILLLLLLLIIIILIIIR